MENNKLNMMKEIFGSDVTVDDIYYKKADGGIVVGVDEETGKEIIMKNPATESNKLKNINTSMDKMLELDMNLVRSLTSKEAIQEKEEEKRRKDMKKFDRQLIEEGIDPNSPMAVKRREIYENSRKFMRFPKVLDHYMSNEEIEEFKDKLTLDEIEQLKTNKRAGLYITPEMIIGTREGNRKAAESPTFQTMEFLRYNAANGVDISTIDNVFLEKYMPEYVKGRRPELCILIDRCINELEQQLIVDLRANEEVDEEMIEVYMSSKDARIKLVEQTKTFKIEDFRIFEYYFLKFGHHQEDKEQFNPDYKVYSNMTMKDYFEKFQERTGWDFLDVYYHYYKKTELMRNKSGTINDNEVLGKEDIDNIKINNTKEINTYSDVLDIFDDVEF